jgi:hypothetical protein
MKIQPGIGYNFDSSKSGFTLDTSDPFPSRDLFGRNEPLTPGIAGDKVTIIPGTVNRYVPKIGADYIDKVPAPTLTVSDEGYVLVKVTHLTGKFFPRTAEIVFQAVDTPPEDTENESYFILARVTKTTETSPQGYVLQIFSSGSLAVNRLKAGNNMATWWWTRV